MAADSPACRPSDVCLPSPLYELADERCCGKGVRVYLKRDDLIHPDMPGNKWRKLKYNVVAAKDQGYRRLLTFGGAFSNHVRAVAAAGRIWGFDTVGVIRGEERLPLNDTLAYAASQGMVLTYMDRSEYRQKTDPAVVSRLLAQFGPCYVIPEGGSNALAVRGCAELPAEIALNFDVICCACGTGGTLAGIAAGVDGNGARALGFAVLKGGEFLNEDVQRLQCDAYGAATGNWSIECGFHFGGYARKTAALDAFVADFKARAWRGSGLGLRS